MKAVLASAVVLWSLAVVCPIQAAVTLCDSLRILTPYLGTWKKNTDIRESRVRPIGSASSVWKVTVDPSAAAVSDALPETCCPSGSVQQIERAQFLTTADAVPLQQKSPRPSKL